MQFIDEATIYIKAGDGGNGCVSFRRDKYEDMGGPDGGDGGRGGSIIFQSTRHLNTLYNYRYNQQFIAKNGHNGKGSNRSGKSEENLILKVPVGTQIFTEDGLLLYDFTNEDQSYPILEGGYGGLGNSHFKTSINQAPTRRTEGKKGEEIWISIKLKILSDAGLVGLPNSGKSTFLASTTNAKPKIADYPFTTLTPGLGIVCINDEEFILADIPGLIEGAHMGHGLGDKFLKHIERCRVIIHLIDVASEDIANDYLIIRNELESYSPLLKDKKEIICLNKCDLLNDIELQDKINYLRKTVTAHVIPISGYTQKGIKDVLKLVLNLIKEENF